MIFPTWLVIVLGIIYYLVVPLIIWGCFSPAKLRKTFTIVYLVLFLVVLFCGVFGKVSISNQHVSIIFDFSGKWFAKSVSFGFSDISNFDNQFCYDDSYWYSNFIFCTK